MTPGTWLDSEAWQAAEQHFRRLHEPALGRPHRLLEPHVTADGTSVAVTGVVYDELAGLPRQGVYLVDGGSLRQLAAAVGPARQARFSPDGTRLAFLADPAADGRFQLHLVDCADPGARPQAAPPVPGTAEYCAWSPDGTKVLLGVAGLGADLAGQQGSGTTAQPARQDVPGWFPQVDAGAAEDSWRSLWIYDLTAGQLRKLSPDGLNVWEAAWLGSSAVAAVTSPAPGESAWYTAVLTRLGLDGGVAELRRSPVQLGLPAGSPDGSCVAVVEAVCSDRGVIAGDLLVGTAGGALERIDTGGVDVTAVQWADGGRLGLLGIRGLETVAVLYDARTGKCTEVWTSTATSCGYRYPDGAWTADGRIVVVEEGYRTPQQVVVLGAGHRVLADVAHPGTGYLLSVAGTAAPVSWQAPDGLRIEGILCAPPGDGPFPLVVNIHGGPVWAYRNVWSLYYAWTPFLVSRGYAVLSPNPRGSSGRGQDFARMVVGDMGGDDTWDFTSAVDALIARGVADPARIGLMGGSYGGFMSAWLVTQDQRWAAAVPTSPVVNWYSQHFTSNIPHFDTMFLNGQPQQPGSRYHRRSPVLHADRVRTPCLNVAGALDRCAPPTQAQEFHQALLERGVRSALAVYPQEGHGVRAFPALIDYCARVLDWFDQHMSPDKPS